MNASVITSEDRARLSRQCAEILERLRQGPATNRELAAISLKYTSRTSDLRAAGYVIDCERLDGGLTKYTLGRAPSEPGEAVNDYQSFIVDKSQLGGDAGFAPMWMPSFLFDFQAALVEWALRKGRAAIFADCGLGKSPMELVWAENVVRKTGKPVLLLTPLAVSAQMLREADKFDIRATRSADGVVHPGINISNYQRLHYFKPDDFAGIVCDESSILKSFDGVTRANVTDFARKLPYRLLCTATAAPNDYVELGTSSEALGYLGHMDMLNRFFVNSRNTSDTRGHWRGSSAPRHYEGPMWRFRGHAETPFWRWVCSWARSVRRPGDLGFDDGRFILPPLDERQHIIEVEQQLEGRLLALPAFGLAEERKERRRTLEERCAKAAALIADTGQPAVAWCQLNDEGDLLERLIPDAVQVSGKDSDDEKEEKFEAFTAGRIRVLVTKPILAAWGLNWQHCAHMTLFSGHSFEQYYQSIRRFWRFGQTKAVLVEHVISEGEARVLQNLQRKAGQAERMFEEITRHMREEISIAPSNHGALKATVPSWLESRGGQ